MPPQVKHHKTPWTAFVAASHKLAKAQAARQMRYLTNSNAATLDTKA